MQANGKLQASLVLTYLHLCLSDFIVGALACMHACCLLLDFLAQLTM
jgi:hypothetical protein